MFYFLLIVVSLVLDTNSYAATFFVAKTGSNANSCSAARNPATPKLSISAGIGCLASGDTLNIGAGTYSETISGDAIPNGTASAYTRVMGTGATTIIRRTGENHGIYFFSSAKQYIEISDMQLDGTGTSGGAEGVRLAEGRNLRLRNLDVHHFQLQGIRANANVTNVEILNCDIHHIGMPLGNCGDPLGRNGYCHGLYIDGNAFIIDGVRLRENNGYGVQFYQSSDNSTIRNSLIYANQSTGVFCGFGENVRVLNNTVYGNGGLGINCDMGNAHHIRNNVAGSNAAGNLNINDPSNTVSNNLTTNPSFVNAGAADFRLQSGSPAIDAAAPLADVPHDFAGTVRPQGKAYDIGAYEHIESVLNPPLSPPTDLRVTVTEP